MEIELNFKISDFGVQLSDTHREKILISSLSFSFKTEVTITRGRVGAEMEYFFSTLRYVGDDAIREISLCAFQICKNF